MKAETSTLLRDHAVRGFDNLEAADPDLFALLDREHVRQAQVLSMVASSSIADSSVLFAAGTAIGNVTGEGYPGARFHAGCSIADEIENLAIERAKAAFSARYANVQPHSGTSANLAVLFSLLNPGDTILGMDLDAGGHLSHGAKASVLSKTFRTVSYGVNEDGVLDYDAILRIAEAEKPAVIVCGASAYPRTIDFARFRGIADSVGAYLLADISHIAGLVAAGVHPSPIDHAHITTTSTYKQLYGPRGGLILMGRDYDQPGPSGKRSLSDVMQRAVFPFFQGTPSLNLIAAKARALHFAASPAFRDLAIRIAADARALAASFEPTEYRVLTGGTDNHMVLLDLRGTRLTGVIAERALEDCNLLVNKNRIPGDVKPVTVTSGIRLGTNTLALRGMGPSEMRECASIMQQVLAAINPRSHREFDLPASARDAARAGVANLCERFPIPVS